MYACQVLFRCYSGDSILIFVLTEAVLPNFQEVTESLGTLGTIQENSEDIGM